MNPYLIDDSVLSRPIYGEPRTAAAETLLHQAADIHVPKLANAVAYAFARGRQAINPEALRRAHGSKAALERAMAPAVEAMRQTLQRVFMKPFLACLVAGGEVGTRMLLPRIKHLRTAKADDKKIGLAMSFDGKSQEAIDWATEHVGELIDDLTQTTLDDITEAIINGLAGDLSVDEMISDVSDAVGDDTRGQLIARTESMRAVSEGQRQAWDQAVGKGLLTGDEKRVWIATSGACDECAGLDGETADIDGEYPEPGGDGPPQHPRCRCTEGLQFD